MPDTFGDVYRRVKLEVPDAPVFLIREWVNDAWKMLARRRRWNFMRAEGTLVIQASRSLTNQQVNFGSTLVFGGPFVTGDVGRQLTLAGYPIYTIVAYDTLTGGSATLDRAYTEESSSTATLLVYDAYAVPPADFASFRVVADTINQRCLAFWITEDQLASFDPTRMTSDSGPRCLIAAQPSVAPATLGRIQFEYWPRPTTARSYPYLYNKQASRIDDSTTFSGVLGDGGDVLRNGALSLAAGWPGTADRPNAYYGETRRQERRAEFDLGVQMLSLRDDEQYPDDLMLTQWYRWPLADLAYNDHTLRETDATVDAYW